MREILFKGLLKIGKGWAFGNLRVDKKGCTIITPDETPLGIYGVVDPETVCQYTGLTDKNGVKIFEGDIVRYNNINDFDIHSVVKIGEYNQDGSGDEYSHTRCVGVFFEIIDFTRPDWAEEYGTNPPDYDSTISPFDSNVIGAEVIGNIHDKENGNG